MIRAPYRLIGFGILAIGLSGCAAFLLGAGAAGGYAISKDSIKNRFELPPSHVYRVSRDVIGEVGFVAVDDERRGLIKANVEGVTVTITIKPISEKSVELVVRARNNLLLPKIDTAQMVYNRIIQHL